VTWLRVRTPWWIAPFVVASVCAAGPASAQAQPVPLAWNAPPGCPTAAAVLADVDRNLAASGEGRAAFVAVVNVSERPKGLWQAHLVVEARGGRAERGFEAESCQAIASATALIIALAAQVGDGGQAADAGERFLPPRQDDREAMPAPPYGQRSRLGLMVSGLVDGGIIPKRPAAGLEVAVGPSWTASGWRSRVLASGAFFFPRTADFPSSTASGDFWRLAVSGRGCVGAGGRFEIGICVGGELSAMHSHGPLDSGLADATRYWLSAAASTIVTWNVRPQLALFVRSDVTVPAWHPTFYADAGYGLYDVPGVAVGGGLGVELHFR